MYTHLESFITTLREEDELIELHDFFSPELEITELYDRIVKSKGKAILFHNNGTAFPLLINAYGSEKRIRLALGVHQLDDIGEEIKRLLRLFTSPKENLFSKIKLLPELYRLSQFFPHVSNRKKSCQEIVIRNPDLSILPILKCWPYDAGKFITLPVVHTVDPVTGSRNVGMYRMQVMGTDTTGMHWHLHKDAAKHFQAYKQLGKKMPISVILGGDPIYTYVSTAPLPDLIDEYLVAGFLRKKRVELVKCITNEIEVPADADIVIEGYVDPDESPVKEGPFGDHTGFYSLDDFYPKFHVTCITHRKNAIYPATVVGIPPQEDGWLAKATERIFLALIQCMVPEVVDISLPAEGCFHNLALVKIKKSFPGQGVKIIQGLWGLGQMMNTKNIICFDDSVNIHDNTAVFSALMENVQIPEDLFCAMGPLDALDHAGISFAFGGKMGIDATKKLVEEQFTSQPIAYTPEALPNFVLSVKEPEKEIAILFIEKNKENNLWLKENASRLFTNKKALIWVEKEAQHLSLPNLVWWVLSNTDPKRDFSIHNKCLLIDGTRKTASVDDIKRRWPEILVMDDDTIQKIDEKWDSLGLPERIASPSLQYKPLVTSHGAEAKV